MRASALVLCLALASAGCAANKSNGMPDRTVARNILIGVVAGSVAVAVGSAVAGKSVENGLRDDLARGDLSGTDFAHRDDQGRRWNRIARASLYVGGLAALGLGILWEMSAGDRLQVGPREQLPPPGPPSAALPPLPPPTYRSATAR